MRTPYFWYQPPGFLSSLLWPLGWLYGKIGKIIFRLKTQKRFQVPIISVGNIVSGGSGKTPTAIALMHLLESQGFKVHFVTRGYGGREQGPLAVDPTCHKPSDVEMKRSFSPTCPNLGREKRACGVERAIEKGAQLIILDDGHQTTGLYKDVSFVVIDQLQGFGNGCVIPAGPLREDLSEGLKRADGVISVQCSVFSVQSILDHSNLSEHCFKAKIVPQSLSFASNRVVAFCGLGFPQKFYMFLKDLGLDLTATETFPDHYQYTNEDLFRLQKLAQKHDSILVTTRKDLVKIPSPWQEQLHVLDIAIDFEDPDKLCDFILERIRPLKESD